jgi:hypothetical protein
MRSTLSGEGVCIDSWAKGMSDTESLTAGQIRRLEKLPEDHELVTTGHGSPIVRGPRGELLRVRPNGRLVAVVESVQSYLYVHG